MFLQNRVPALKSCIKLIEAVASKHLLPNHSLTRFTHSRHCHRARFKQIMSKHIITTTDERIVNSNENHGMKSTIYEIIPCSRPSCSSVTRYILDHDHFAIKESYHADSILQLKNSFGNVFFFLYFLSTDVMFD